jgi:hypothetical protein
MHSILLIYVAIIGTCNIIYNINSEFGCAKILLAMYVYTLFVFV